MKKENPAIFISLIEGSEEENRELSEIYFNGELLEWSARRNRLLGDYILPKVIYVETVDDHTHKVAWVEHNGLNPSTEERFQNHHVVCECVLCKNFNDGRGGINTSLCEVMGRALEAKARMIGEQFQLSIDASQEHNHVNFITGSSEPINQFDLETLVSTAIVQVLQSDWTHPEVWHGNTISGSLPLESAGKIINQPREVVSHSAEILQKTGKVEISDGSVRLAA